MHRNLVKFSSLVRFAKLINLTAVYFPFLTHTQAPIILIFPYFHLSYSPQSNPVGLFVRSYYRTFHPLLGTSLLVLSQALFLSHHTSSRTRSTTLVSRPRIVGSTINHFYDQKNQFHRISCHDGNRESYVISTAQSHN